MQSHLIWHNLQCIPSQHLVESWSRCNCKNYFDVNFLLQLSLMSALISLNATVWVFVRAFVQFRDGYLLSCQSRQKPQKPQLPRKVVTRRPVTCVQARSRPLKKYFSARVAAICTCTDIVLVWLGVTTWNSWAPQSRLCAVFAYSHFAYWLVSFRLLSFRLL